MTIHFETKKLENRKTGQVRSVAEFAQRYRLHLEEQSKLLKLLGPVATQQELLMNARRDLQVR
jgi:hypothetical protein